MTSFFSPHIFIYKPQTNSVFSLFLRFILILIFADFMSYALSFSFFNTLVFSYFLDLVYISEIVIIFYVLAILAEEFIDYDSVDLNYWDVDLVTFFNFFFVLVLLLGAISLIYLILQFTLWSVLIVT
jgi:hypothetical protein